MSEKDSADKESMEDAKGSESEGKSEGNSTEEKSSSEEKGEKSGENKKGDGEKEKKEEEKGEEEGKEWLTYEDFFKDREFFILKAKETLQIIKSRDRLVSVLKELVKITKKVEELEGNPVTKHNTRIYVVSCLIPYTKALLLKELKYVETFEATNKLFVESIVVYLREWRNYRGEMKKVKKTTLEEEKEEKEKMEKLKKEKKWDRKEETEHKEWVKERKKKRKDEYKTQEKRLLKVLDHFSVLFDQSNVFYSFPRFHCSRKSGFKDEYRIDKLESKGDWGENSAEFNITSFSHKKMSLFFVLNVYHFCRMGGVKFVMDELLDIDFTYVQFFLDIFGKILPAFKKPTNVELMNLIIDTTTKHFKELKEEELEKFVDIDVVNKDERHVFLSVIVAINLILKQNAAAFKRSINRKKVKELLHLHLNLNLFKSSRIDNKIVGLTGINQIIKKIEASEKRTLKVITVSKMWTTHSYFCDWIIRNKILEDVFEHHDEIIKKSKFIISFLANSNKFSKDQLRKLWELTIKKHESQQSLIFNSIFVSNLLPYLEPKQMDDFFDIIMTTEITLLKNHLIKMFKQFTLIGNKLYRKNYGFTVLINLTQDKNFISNEVLDYAQSSLLDLIESSFTVKDKNVMKFLVANIESIASVPQSINALKSILQSVKKTKSMMSQVATITGLLFKYLDYIFGLDFSKLKVEVKRVVDGKVQLETFRKLRNVKEITESERFFLKRNTKLELLDNALNFLTFLLEKFPQMNLLPEYCEKLWNHLSKSKLIAEERNCVIDWFIKAKHHFQDLMKFFEDVVLNLSPSDLDIKFFLLFINYFIKVNTILKKIKRDDVNKVRRIVVVDPNLSGIERLWEIVLTCKDKVVAKYAKNYLNDFRSDIVKKPSLIKRVREEHIKKCMDFLENSRSTFLESEKKSNSEERIIKCIDVLQDYLLLFLKKDETKMQGRGVNNGIPIDLTYKTLDSVYDKDPRVRTEGTFRLKAFSKMTYDEIITQLATVMKYPKQMLKLFYNGFQIDEGCFDFEFLHKKYLIVKKLTLKDMCYELIAFNFGALNYRALENSVIHKCDQKARATSKRLQSEVDRLLRKKEGVKGGEKTGTEKIERGELKKITEDEEAGWVKVKKNGEENGEEKIVEQNGEGDTKEGGKDEKGDKKDEKKDEKEGGKTPTETIETSEKETNGKDSTEDEKKETNVELIETTAEAPIPENEGTKEPKKKEREDDPVTILSKYFIDLFKLLDLSENIAKHVFTLLLYLPTNKEILAQISEMKDLGDFLPENGRYKLLYSLQIISKDFLLQGEWKKRFVEKGGVQHITDILKKTDAEVFSQNKLFLECFSYLLKCLNFFFKENHKYDMVEIENIIKKIYKTLIVFNVDNRGSDVVEEFRKRVYLNVVSAPKEKKVQENNDRNELLISYINEVINFYKNSFEKDSKKFLEVIFYCPEFKKFIRKYLLSCSDDSICLAVINGLKKFADFSEAMDVIIDIFFEEIEKTSNKIFYDFFVFLLKSSKKITNLEKKVLIILELIVTRQIKEKTMYSEADDYFVGLVDVLSILVGKLDNKTKMIISSSKMFAEFVRYLFPDKKTFGMRKDGLVLPVCKSKEARQAVYRFFIELCAGCVETSTVFIESLRKIMKETTDREKNQKRIYYKNPHAYLRESNIKFVGLKNLGATCYMNSLLQQLYMTIPFRKDLLKMKLENEKRNDPEVFLFELQRVFAFLKYSTKKYYIAVRFCKSYKDYDLKPINVHVQRDVDEFLFKLMDNVEVGLKKSSDPKMLNHCYKGVTVTDYIHENTVVSQRKEDFFKITVVVKKTLLESLRLFIDDEHMTGKNQYRLEVKGVKKMVDAVRRTTILTLPPILIFHLKRFEYKWEMRRNEKLYDRLEFPHTLDMKPYCVKDKEHVQDDAYYQYKLVGILVHRGGADSGHYYSFIMDRSNKNEDWYEFNDSSITKYSIEDIEDDCFGGKVEIMVKKEKKEQIRRNSAYMLFYQRVSTLYSHLETKSGEKEEVSKQVEKKSKISEIKNCSSKVFLKHLDKFFGIIQEKYKRNDLIKSESPKEIFEDVWNDNYEFFQDLKLYSNEFNDFFTKLVRRTPLHCSLKLIVHYIGEVVSQSLLYKHVDKWNAFLNKIEFTSEDLCVGFLGVFIADTDFLLSVLIKSKVKFLKKLFTKKIVQCLKMMSVFRANRKEEISGKNLSVETVNKFLNEICVLLKTGHGHKNFFQHLLNLVLEISKIGTFEKKFFIANGVIGRICNIISIPKGVANRENVHITQHVTRNVVVKATEAISYLARCCTVNDLSANSPNVIAESAEDFLKLQDSEVDILFGKDFLPAIVKSGVNSFEVNRFMIHWCWESLENSKKISSLIINAFSKAPPPKKDDLTLDDSDDDEDPDENLFAYLRKIFLIEDSQETKRIREVGNIFVKDLKDNMLHYDVTLRKIKYIAGLGSKNKALRDFLGIAKEDLEEVCRHHKWKLSFKVKDPNDNIYKKMDEKEKTEGKGEDGEAVEANDKPEEEKTENEVEEGENSTEGEGEKKEETVEETQGGKSTKVDEKPEKMEEKPEKVEEKPEKVEETPKKVEKKPEKEKEAKLKEKDSSKKLKKKDKSDEKKKKGDQKKDKKKKKDQKKDKKKKKDNEKKDLKKKKDDQKTDSKKKPKKKGKGDAKKLKKGDTKKEAKKKKSKTGKGDQKKDSKQKISVKQKVEAEIRQKEETDAANNK